MTQPAAPSQPARPDSPRSETSPRQGAPRMRRLDCSEAAEPSRRPAERSRPAADPRLSGRSGR